MSEYLKVLVVHRQDSMVGDIKAQFDSAGWLVHVAQNGLDGLLLARKENYSLILTVIDLPVITGIEMVRGIRNFSFNVSTSVVFIDDPNTENDYGPILGKLNARIHIASNKDFSELTQMFDPIPSKNNYLRIM